MELLLARSGSAFVLLSLLRMETRARNVRIGSQFLHSIRSSPYRSARQQDEEAANRANNPEENQPAGPPPVAVVGAGNASPAVPASGLMLPDIEQQTTTTVQVIPKSRLITR